MTQRVSPRIFPRSRPSAPGRAALACAFALISIACGRGGEQLAPLYRLTEGSVATVADDTRYVLRKRPKFELLNRPLESREDGAVSQFLSFPPEFRPWQQLAIQLAARVGGRWKFLDWRVVSLEDRGDRVAAKVEVSPQELGAIPEGTLYVRGHPVLDDERSLHDTAVLELPRGAILQTSVALVHASSGAEPVRFSISSCFEDACDLFFEHLLDAKEGQAGWTDLRIPIPAEFMGERSLRFETEHRAAPGEVAMPVWGDPTVLTPSGDAAQRPNVILLSLDTLGADHLRSYGYDRDTAPFLSEELPQRATLFNRFLAGSSSTGPSHMTMFTSLTPLSHGVTEGKTRFADAAVTLAQVLREAGYATVAVTENGPLAAARGFSRGFSIYKENTSANLLRPEGHIRETLRWGADWVEENRDQSFFLFLHSYEVHGPYRAPDAYQSLFVRTGPQATPERTAYDQEIRYADDQIRSFFEELEAEGLLDNAIVLITSDHGEEFYEHRYIGHGGGLYREVLQVPLIIFGKGIAEGRRVAGTATHVDLAPTILDLLGMPPLEYAVGRSLKGALRVGGVARVDSRDRAILHSAWIAHQLGFRGATAPSFAIDHKGRKLVRYSTKEGPRFELFDLETDPYEKNDLSARYPQVVAELDRILEEEIAAARATGKKLARESSGRAPELEREPEPELGISSARERKLRALGYLE